MKSMNSDTSDTLNQGDMGVSTQKQLVVRALTLLGTDRKPSDVQARNTLARIELDRFFTEVVLPRLCELHKTGRLPDLSKDSVWAQVEAEWDKAGIHSQVPCDVEQVKGLMWKAVKTYKAGKSQPGLF